MDDDLTVLVLTQSYSVIADEMDWIFKESSYEYDIDHVKYIDKAMRDILAKMNFTSYKNVKIIVESKQVRDTDFSPYMEVKFYLKFDNKHDVLAYKLKK